MSRTWESLLRVEVVGEDQRRQLAWVARARNWGLALMLVGWLHLLAFSLCYYLTIVHAYHHAPPYLAIWVVELLTMWLLFRLCGGRRPAGLEPGPLESLLRRIWIAYFLLAFNLGSMNTLRGHQLFELFPAIASLASFAFLTMAVVLDGRFFGAVLVMFASGLLMAAHLLHAYLIFALTWWLVLNGIGWTLWCARRQALRETKGSERIALSARTLGNGENIGQPTCPGAGLRA